MQVSRRILGVQYPPLLSIDDVHFTAGGHSQTSIERNRLNLGQEIERFANYLLGLSAAGRESRTYAQGFVESCEPLLLSFQSLIRWNTCQFQSLAATPVRVADFTHWL